MVQTRTDLSSGAWGRAWYVSAKTSLGIFLLMTVTPLVVFYYYIAAFSYGGALAGPISAVVSGELWSLLPSFSSEALGLLTVWLSLQLVLAVVPDLLHRAVGWYRGGWLLGAMTPAGNRLWYNINGLQAWVISHILFVVGAFWFGWFSPTIIFDNWGGLLVLANCLGFGVAIFAFVKAYLFPSHPEDRKFSGNILYDFYMGIELNPRIGSLDFKLFFNGRPGIVAWTMINLSFAAEQFQRYGYVTNSMLLVNLLQGLYVLYFFYKESWYLNTIDIHHDHFGCYFGFGDCVWLPFMYTLQGLYLVFNPVDLSVPYALFVLVLGFLGFGIFVSANNQKDAFRRSDGAQEVWGKKPTFVRAQYRTSDGQVRESKLLTSGWWGVGRHMNYMGDLILSLCYSLACGYGHFFPYFYFVFILILLVHRCVRDEHRCLSKYGEAWKEYSAKVPYRLIPGIF